MKKSLKNTVMIGLAVVLIGTSAVTFCYAKEGSAPQPQIQNEQQIPYSDFGNGRNPIENFGQNNQNQNGENNGRNMPQPPQGNQQQGGNSQPPQQNNGEQQKPDGAPNDNATQQDDSSESSQQAPQSDGTSLTESTEITEVNRNMPIRMRGGRSNWVSALCYAFLAVQIAIVLLIISYLAFSKFNKLSYNQTVAKFRE